MRLICLDVPRPGASLETYQPHMIDELRHTWGLYKDGVVRDIYFRQDRPGVVIVAEAESVEAATATFAEFPLAKAGLIDWEIIPFGPFTNWEALFTPRSAPFLQEKPTATR